LYLIDFLNYYLGIKMNKISEIISNLPKFNNNIAIIDCDNNAITYSELYNKLNDFSYFLRNDLKLNSGERVSMNGGWSLNDSIHFLGAIYANLVAFPLNPRFPLNRSEELITKVGVVRNLELNTLKNNSINNNINSNINDEAVIIATSGSSGFPKAVVHNNSAVLAALDNQEFLNLDENKKVFCLSPICHIMGASYLLSALKNGATIVLHNSLDVNKIVTKINDYAIDTLIAIPTVYNLLPSDPLKNSSIKMAISGGQILPVSFINKFYDRTGIMVQTGYGMSELFGITGSTKNGLVELGDVGYPFKNVKLKILDENYIDLGAGNKGIIAINSPYIAKNYSDGTSLKKIKIHSEEYFITNDYGYLREDNGLTFLGRKDDIINVNGDKVSGCFLENIIFDTGFFNNVAVIGVPYQKSGEAPVGFAVPKNNLSIDIELVYSNLREKLSKFELPIDIKIVSELPLLVNNKIDKKKLLEWYSNA